jgi:hypothetical protein
LRQRLASPALEWRDSTAATKARVLALLFVPPVVLVAAVVRRRRGCHRCLPDDFLQLALAALCLAFAWWYFFWNQFMWVRHVDPALLVGFAVLGYSTARVARRASSDRRTLAVAGTAGAILVGAVTGMPAAWTALRTAPLGASAAHFCSSDTPWSVGPWPRCVPLMLGTPRPLPSPRPTVDARPPADDAHAPAT